MNDPTPLADPVEDRLRAALRAEADRRPVTPDLEGLRARADRTVVDLRLPPRRNRARLVAAAAVLALLAGAVGAIALRGDDEDGGEPVIADQPPPTGYYLPGDGWEVQEIIGLPVPGLPGAERMVEYGAPLSQADLGTGSDGDASIMVFRTEDEDPDLLALAAAGGLTGSERVARGDGGDAREYVVSPLSGFEDEEGEAEVVDPASIETTGGSLAASVDGRVLIVDWYGPIGREAMLDLADRWWTSGGEAVALDPATGLVRLADVTYPDVEPVPAEEMASFGGLDDIEDLDDLYADADLQVTVLVEAPDGWTGAYSASPPGHAVPTGLGDPEAGAAAGLSPAEVGAPLPPEVGGPAPAWESSTGILAEVPGATLGIARTSYMADALTAERARQLWAALAPVDHDAWVDAAADAAEQGGLAGDVWGETLATTDPSRYFDALDAEAEAGTSAGAGEGEGIPFAGVTVTPRDGVNPAVGRAPAEVDRLVADAVLAFVGGTEPVDADLFAPATTFRYEDPDDVHLSVAIEEVGADAEAAITEIPPEATMEAWNVLWTVTPAEMTRLVAEGDGACPPLDQVAADPAVVVLVQDVSVDGEPCTDWSALVVGLDDQQRITTIEARFGP